MVLMESHAKLPLTENRHNDGGGQNSIIVDMHIFLMYIYLMYLAV